MPGACYFGDTSVRYQWEVFGKNYDFTPTEATGAGRAPPEEIRPGRLGCELIIPRDTLSPGTHKVDFRVWLGNVAEPSATDSHDPDCLVFLSKLNGPMNCLSPDLKVPVQLSASKQPVSLFTCGAADRK